MGIINFIMLEDLARDIAETFHPKKIILFGSNAWGIPQEDSDIDIFIIMDSKEERPSKRAIEILTKCHPGNISVDLMVRTPEEIKKRLEVGDTFIQKIIKDGKVIYDESL